MTPTPRKISLRNVRAATASSIAALDNQAEVLGALARDIQTVATQLAQTQRALDAHLNLTFWGRLRFLVKGR